MAQLGSLLRVLQAEIKVLFGQILILRLWKRLHFQNYLIDGRIQLHVAINLRSLFPSCWPVAALSSSDSLVLARGLIYPQSPQQHMESLLGLESLLFPLLLPGSENSALKGSCHQIWLTRIVSLLPYQVNNHQSDSSSYFQISLTLKGKGIIQD